MPRLKLKRLLGVSAVGAALAAGIRGLAWRHVNRFENLTPETANPPGSFIDVDGVRLNYVEAGSGPPLVLIHGWQGSTFGFRYTIADLSAKYRVIAVDLKGYGFSARPDHGDYSREAQADLVARFMEALGIERATVGGHSMGGGVAQALAIRHPERVDRLILVDSVTPRESSRMRGGRLMALLLPIIAIFTLRRPFIERVLRFNVHDPEILTPDVIEGHVRPLRMKGHLRAQQLQMRARLKERPIDSSAVRQPALLLWGEHDRIIPLRRGKDLARWLPDARLVIVPSAGHLPLEEQPEFCKRELFAFLDERNADSVEWPASAEPAEAAT
jgi:pimeloyl-ACP methyl ester carboxylesterase